MMEVNATKTKTVSKPGYFSTRDEIWTRKNEDTPLRGNYKWNMQWGNVLLFSILHLLALFGLFRTFKGRADFRTLLWTVVLTLVGHSVGVIAGTHRYWTHRAFKAKTPLRLLMLFCQTMCLQHTIWEWSRDHLLHHKFTDTDSDPYNSRRGFFYSHLGWMLLKKEPEVLEAMLKVDVVNLKADPLVGFQKKYYFIMAPLIGFLFPSFVPWYFWNENFLLSLCLPVAFRWMWSTHCTALINSAAHMWGTRPYNKAILPADNIVLAILASGEGFHNYHHTFPWDYKTSELGSYSTNITCMFIEFMAYIGWAYDLRTATDKQIITWVKNNGDGSRVIDEDIKD